MLVKVCLLHPVPDYKSNLYIWGALLQEFGVWVRPRSVTCIHISLTLRMRHSKVPQTVRRDIWRPAIETPSIPSLHIIRSRIRNQIQSRIENRKEPNGPIRKSNCLTKKKIPHTLCHTEFLLGLIDVVQGCVSNEPFYENNVAVEIPFAARYSRPSESALRKLCTNINQPYLIWAAVICHVPPPKDQWYWDPQSNRPKAKIWKVHDVVVVYVVVDDLELLQRWSPAGQLNLKLLNINE